jgi:hypothetical protein
MSNADETQRAPEPDRPPMGRIFGLLAGLSVVVLVIVLGLSQLFKRVVRDEIYDKELSVVSKDLQEARARDEGHLTGYAVIDGKQGVYQIPIARAMDELLAHPALIQGFPGASAASQPAASQPAAPTPQPPAPAPAPTKQVETP